MFKNGYLHSQESQGCKWVINIGKILKNSIGVSITTQTIRMGDQM